MRMLVGLVNQIRRRRDLPCVPHEIVSRKLRTFSLADLGEGTFVTSMAERLQGLVDKHAVKAEIMLEQCP